MRGRPSGLRAVAPRQGDASTPAYLALWRLLRSDEAGSDLYPSEGETLRLLAGVKSAADLMIVRAIDDARAAGYGWEEIGQSLGMTRQGAQVIATRAAAAGRGLL